MIREELSRLFTREERHRRLFARLLTPVAGVVWLQSVVALAALKLPLPVVGDAVHSTLRVVLTQIAPPTLVVAFVVAAIRRYHATKVPAPTVSAPAG